MNVEQEKEQFERPPLFEDRFLVGKRGIMIDSVIASGYFLDYVESLGGVAWLFQTIPNNLVDIVRDEGVDFVIVHNYLVGELETLLELRKVGVEVLLIKRCMVPTEELDKHERLCKSLNEAGVVMGKSVFRVNAVRRFLNNKYSV